MCPAELPGEPYLKQVLEAAGTKGSAHSDHRGSPSSAQCPGQSLCTPAAVIASRTMTLHDVAVSEVYQDYVSVAEPAITTSVSESRALAFTLPPSVTWTSAIVLCVEVLTGIIGNCIVMLTVFKNKSLRTPMNGLIVNLCVADMAICMLSSPVLMALLLNDSIWLNGTSSVYSMYILCLVEYTSHIVIGSVLLVTLVCISIERYHAIAQPFDKGNRWSRIKLSIAFSWMLGVVIALVGVFMTNDMQKPHIVSTHQLLANAFMMEFFHVVFIPFSIFCVVLVFGLYFAIVYLIQKHAASSDKKLSTNKTIKKSPKVIPVQTAEGSVVASTMLVGVKSLGPDFCVLPKSRGKSNKMVQEDGSKAQTEAQNGDIGVSVVRSAQKEATKVETNVNRVEQHITPTETLIAQNGKYEPLKEIENGMPDGQLQAAMKEQNIPNGDSVNVKDASKAQVDQVSQVDNKGSHNQSYQKDEAKATHDHQAVGTNVVDTQETGTLDGKSKLKTLTVSALSPKASVNREDSISVCAIKPSCSSAEEPQDSVCVVRPKGKESPKPPVIEICDMNGKHVTATTTRSDVVGNICMVNNVNKERGKRKVEARTAKVTAIVMGAFLTCWLPLPTVILASRNEFKESQMTMLQKGVLLVSLVISSLTAAINPVVYGLVNRQIRNGIVRLAKKYLPAGCKLPFKKS